MTSTNSSSSSAPQPWPPTKRGVRFLIVGTLTVVLIVYLVVVFALLVPTGYASWEQAGAAIALTVAAVPAGAVGLRRYENDWFLLFSCLTIVMTFCAQAAVMTGTHAAVPVLLGVVAAALGVTLFFAGHRNKGSWVYVWRAAPWDAP